MCQTSSELLTIIQKSQHRSDEKTRRLDQNSGAIENQVLHLRENVIAPLQTLQARFPKLKLRLEHRRGALETYQKYECKVHDLSRTYKPQSARMQRNKLKLHASQERFQELDHEVQEELQTILSEEHDAIFNSPLSNLLLTQIIWTEQFRACTMELQHVINPAIVDPQPLMKEGDEGCENNDKKDDSETQQEVLKELDVPVASIASIASASASSNLARPQTEEAMGEKFLKACESKTIVLDKRRSFRQKHKHQVGTRSHAIHHHVKNSLALGMDLKESVMLPEGYRMDEWIGVHVIDFFNEISLLFGTISEFCTDQSCPAMSAGPCYTYLLWADGMTIQTPVSVSAPRYVEHLMGWIERQINDEESPLFQFGSGRMVHNPKGTTIHDSCFDQMARTILKRMFRVYAHMYHSHLDHFMSLKADSHLNFCFKRFIFFVLEFDMVDKKELNALKKLITAIVMIP